MLATSEIIFWLSNVVNDRQTSSKCICCIVLFMFGDSGFVERSRTKFSSTEGAGASRRLAWMHTTVRAVDILTATRGRRQRPGVIKSKRNRVETRRRPR